MTAKILDGKAIAKQVQAEIKTEVTAFVAESNVTPTLAAVLAVSYTHLTLPTIYSV